jgi:hypothetical protein
LVLAEQDAEEEPYKPDEARSAEQSCAAQVSVARPQPAERLDVACSELKEQRAARKRSLMAPRAQVE